MECDAIVTLSAAADGLDLRVRRRGVAVGLRRRVGRLVARLRPRRPRLRRLRRGLLTNTLLSDTGASIWRTFTYVRGVQRGAL